MSTNPFAGFGVVDAGIAVSAPADQPAAQQGSGDEVRDVIIIGSGPAGYTAAIYTARAQLRPIVLEGSIDSGGALMTTTEVENYPGFREGIMGPELMGEMRAQAERFGAELIADEAVRVTLDGDVKEVEDSDGNVYRARAVILAMGSKYRELGIDDENVYRGKGVSWCATCDGFFYKDKEIAVVGGGDSAAEEADFLTRFGSKVTLIHRRDALRASKIMAQRILENPKIEMAWNSSVVAMSGEPTLQSVTLQDTVTGEQRELAVSGLFVAIGHDPRSDLVRGQVELDEGGYVKVNDPGTATNLPGVFACGDLVDHTYRQAITAAGSGCRAALDTERYLVSITDTTQS